MLQKLDFFFIELQFRNIDLLTENMNRFIDRKYEYE